MRECRVKRSSGQEEVESEFKGWSGQEEAERMPEWWDLDSALVEIIFGSILFLYPYARVSREKKKRKRA